MMLQGPQLQTDFGAPYYPPPPPLQQQYPHSQRQNVYPGPPSAMSQSAYDGPSPYTTQGPSSFGADAQHFTNRSQERFETHSQAQSTSRAFSPLSGNASLPPLSRLNTGSSHSTNYSSATPGMSSSMSMLPPGYGREGYVLPAAGNAHSRAHSIAGSVSGQQHHASSMYRSRTQSISHLSESGRTMSGNTASSGTAATTGVFSPAIGHSRAGSLSGSTSSPSPSAAAFNFFPGPTSQLHGTSMQSSMVSTNGNNSSSSGVSRIAPIGRPTHSKTTSVDTIGGSRKVGGPFGQGSASTSGLTSPLGGGFSDGWLDEGTATSDLRSSSTSSTINEGRRTAQSVWN